MTIIFKSLKGFDNLSQILREYNVLIAQLYGPEYQCAETDLWKIITTQQTSELLLFAYNSEGQMVSSAFASYTSRPPAPKAYIDSVVVHAQQRGRGYGHLLMSELHKCILRKWPDVQSFRLTSSPKRNTQGFYTRLGYDMRTKEQGDETIVYVKKS